MSHVIARGDPEPAVPGEEPRRDALADAALVERARDALTGRVELSAVDIPPDVEAFLDAEFALLQPPPTAKARRHIAERLGLQAHYAGRLVVCHTRADGRLAVLADGERDVLALLEGLSDDERAKLWVTDTDESI